MRRTNALKEYLEFLTTVYHPDNKEIEVQWTSDTPHADLDGNYIAINPNVRDWIGKSLDNANELRILADTVSHEVEHLVKSDLRGKKEFMEAHPEAPKVAGSVYNTFEDVYIDFTRTNRWKGLRVSRAFFVDRVLSNSHRHPKLTSVDTKAGKMLEGMLQIALSGYAKGISEIEDEEVKEFLGLVRRRTRELRAIDDVEEREELVEEVTHTLFDIVDLDDAKDFAEDMEIPTGGDFNADDLDLDEESAYEPSSNNEQSNKNAEESGDAEAGGDESQEGEEDGEELEGEGGSGSEGEKDEGDESDEGSTGDGGEDGEEGEGSDSGSDEEDSDGKADGLDEGLDPSEYNDPELDDGEAVQTALPGLGNEERPDPLDLDEQDGQDEAEPAEAEAAGENRRDEPSPSGPAGDAEVGEDVEKEVSEMEQMDQSEQEREWYGVSSDADIQNPNPRFEEKVDELRSATQRDNTSMAEKKSKRDEHADDFNTDYKSVLRTLREKGLDDEIEQAFKELKNSEKEVPVEMGEEVHLQNAIEYRAGDYSRTRVHKHRLPAEYGERCVTVVLDLSGSMPEHTAKVALLGLQRACEAIGDQFAACGFKTFSNNGHKVVYTPLITGPNEDFQPKHLASVFSGGTTPLAAGIDQGQELVEESTRPEQVMIVVTDGKPNVSLDGSGRGDIIGECEQIVNSVRDDGVKVIGMGFGSVNERTMENVFGDEGYVMGELDNLADRLLDVYRKQMRVVDEHEAYR